MLVGIRFNGVPQLNAENIVYCITSIQQIVDSQLDFVFTDGHAVDLFSSQFNIDDLVDIDDILDFKAIKAKFWKDDNDLDLKRRKEAEFLIKGDIPIHAILGYIVYNEKAKTKLLKLGVLREKIKVSENSYF